MKDLKIKDIFYKEKVLFVFFYLVILVISLLLVSILNYDNIILQNEYDFKEKNHMDVNLEYYQMLDNKSKLENAKEFTSNTTKVLLIPSLIGLVFLLLVDTSKMKLSNVYLILGIFIGLFYIFIIPLGGVPDENTHLYKAYEVSLGHFISDKNDEGLGGRILNKKLPSVLTKDYVLENEKELNYVFEDSYKDLNVRYNEELQKEDGEEFIEFSNTAIYSFVGYIPQAVGIAIARIFTDSLRIQCYHGRIINYLVFLSLIYFSIKNIPDKKYLVLFISLLPITIQEATSLSVDGLLIGSSIFLISYVYKLVKEKNEDGSFDRINRNDLILISIFSILVTILKVIYLPLVLIIFLIPKEKFKNVKQKYLVLGIIFIICLILDLLIMVNSTRYVNRIAAFDASVKLQLIGILKNPIQFVKVVLATIKKYGENHILGLFGKELSWLDVNISPIYIFSNLLLFIYFVRVSSKNNLIKVDKINYSKNIIFRLFVLLLILGTTLGILLIEYTSISSVGSLYIDGLQGRYYLPLLLLIGLLFINIDDNKENNNVENDESKKELLSIKNMKLLNMYLFMYLLIMNLHTLTYFMFKYL